MHYCKIKVRMHDFKLVYATFQMVQQLSNMCLFIVKLALTNILFVRKRFKNVHITFLKVVVTKF